MKGIWKEYKTVKEIWKEYKADEIPKDKYEVDSIAQVWGDTKILLYGFENILLAEFGFVKSIRSSDEGVRIETYHEVVEIQEYRKDFFGHPMYKVENSEFFNWAMKDSVGFAFNLHHYAFVTQESIVDVLSGFPPKITVKKLEEGHSEANVSMFKDTLLSPTYWASGD